MTEAAETTILYCYVHPTRETSLRCNRCERPICASCAVRTPTGYRCRNCVREHQKIFDTAVWYDYLIVFLSAALLSGIASVLTLLVTSVVWGLFVIFLAPLAGITIANITRRFVKNHRSRILNSTLVIGMIAGAIPMLIFTGLPALFVMLSGGGNLSVSLYSFSPLLWQGVYLFIAIPSAYSQFSGLLFRR